MAGVKNNTARQLNLRHLEKDRRYLARVKPGMNFIEDEVWEVVSKSKEVADLKKKGHLDWSKDLDKQVSPNAPETKAQVKNERIEANAPIAAPAS